MDMEILSHAFILSMMVFATWISYRPEMIFFMVGDELQKWDDRGGIDRFIAKPLGVCPTCMTSVYGCFYSFLVFGIVDIAEILASLTFTFLLSTIVEFVELKIEKLSRELKAEELNTEELNIEQDAKET